MHAVRREVIQVANDLEGFGVAADVELGEIRRVEGLALLGEHVHRGPVDPLVVVRMDEPPVDALAGGLAIDLVRESSQLVVGEGRAVARHLHARIVERFRVSEERVVG